MSWLQKKLSLWSVVLFYATMNHFSNGLWHEIKSGISMTIGNDQLSGWIQKLQSTSQSQTCTKKRSWSLFGDLLLLWSTTAFWILVETMTSEKCSENWWDTPKTAMLQLALVNRTSPILLHDYAQSHQFLAILVFFFVFTYLSVYISSLKVDGYKGLKTIFNESKIIRI